MTETTFLLCDQAQGILTIGLNRPDKKNAITHAMYRGMTTALEKAGRDRDVRVVLIRGVSNPGPQEVFCAGNDLGEFDRRPTDGPSPGALFLNALSAFEKPVVAAVSGLAVGVGATLLLHCDLVYAAEEARFRLPFVDLGLCPEAGSTWALPARAGYLKAAQALMLGDFFDAQTAVQLGLATAVLPGETLMAHARAAASRLSGKPVRALLQIKHLMKQGTARVLETQMEIEFKAFARLLASDESKLLRANKQKEKKNGR